MDAEPAPGWGELFRGGVAQVTLTLCLGEGVYALNALLVATAMPSAVRELGGVRLIAWTVTLYLVAAIVAGAASGYLKQRMGARRLLTLSGLVFLAGTLAAAGAANMEMVLAGRLLQGLGEGVIAAVCYALLAELIPPRLVSRAFGLTAIVWALSAFAGPMVSGALTEALSWRAAFLVNVPLIGWFLWLVPRVVPQAATLPARALPILRLAGMAAGIMLVAVASVVTSRAIAALLVVLGLAALVGVFTADRRSAVRLFPSNAFASRGTVGAGLWVVLLMAFAQASTSAFLPVSVQLLWGYSPVAAGAIGALMAVSWSLSSVIIARIQSGAVRVRLIQLGTLLLTIGLAGAAFAVPDRRLALLLACQISIGVAFGIGWAFLNQAIAQAALPGEQDLASALVPTTQSGGLAIGAAVAGLVANFSGYADALAGHGDGAAGAWIFGIAACIAAAGIAMSLRMRGA